MYVSRITPIHKKGSNSDIKNHRGISVIPNLSKLFESIILKRLKNYFEKIGVLNPNQYGYRKHRSTELAIFSMLDKVVRAFEGNAYAICIFLDYSACFDTICRLLLLIKLEKHGVRGMPLQLLKSYFENRKQFVSYGEVTSSTKEQKLGVIQGAKCAPLLYDIYTSEFSKLCHEDEYIMFADDTCLLYTGNDLSEIVAEANLRLQTIHDWCCANKLALNPSKSSYMLFTNKAVHCDPIIALDGSPIGRVESFKYLGVTIDDKLKYHDHIEYLSNRISHLCGVSYRLNKHLDLKSAKNIYFSCIYSLLTYCICVYGGVLQCTQRSERLKGLHEKATNYLFKSFCPMGTCVFKQLKILKLEDIHRLYASIYMYKVIKLNECPTLQNNLNLNYPQHRYPTRHQNDPIVPLPRVASVRINFKYQCTQIWREIPAQIKSISGLKAFKKALMAFFLEQY